MPMICWILSSALFLYWLGILVKSARNVRSIPTLADLPVPADPSELPKLSVVVPARNEEAAIGACLTSLLAQDYQNIEIIVVNDRSEDRTGAIADEMAASAPEKITVLHLTECPEGWLGKCNALQQGANKATGDFILFADGDVIFSAGTLSRAVKFLSEEKADMLAVLPDTLTETFGERVITLTFIQSFTLAFSPLKAQDDKSAAFTGVGAFNLIRTTMYRRMHGHRFLKLQVIDDVGLGKLVKCSGGRIRVAMGTGMVRVRWQQGLWGTVKGLEKNAFAALHYNPFKGVIAVTGLLFIYWGPIFGLLFGILGVKLLCALAWVCQAIMGFGIARAARLNPLYALTGPLGSVFLALAILRSMILALKRGGIQWRDQFYPLAELKKYRI